MFIPSLRWCCFLLIVPVLQAVPALAQAVEPDLWSDELPEVTVTATRRPEPAYSVPTAITVVPRARAIERTQTDIADLLRGEPGVFVRATNPSAGSPVIRGVTGRDVLTLVDGFRLSHAFARPNTQYLGYIDPFFLERTEVVRGPGSTLYGSDALGGVVNVLTPEATAGPPQFSFHTDYSSNPAASSTHLQYGFGDERFAAKLGLTYRSFGDTTIGGAWDPRVFFPNPGTTIADSGYEYYAANFKSRLQLAENQTFSLTASVSRIPTVVRQDGVLQGYATNVASAERGFSPQGRAFVMGEYRITFKDTWLESLRLQAGWQQVQDDRFQRNFVNPRPAFPNYNTGTPAPNITLESNLSNLVGTSLVLQSRWGNHRFTYGAEAYFDRVSSARFVRNDRTGTAPDPNGPRYVDGSTMRQYGLFVQDEIRLAPNFEALAGVRWSQVDIRVPFSAIRPLSSGFSRSFSAVTASLGLLYRFVPGAEFVVNLGQGFRAPNINDLAEAGERRVTDINVPNPGLVPERVFSVDGGFKWSTPQLSGELFGFWSRYSDRINSVVLGTQTSADGTVSQLLQTQNSGGETIWGIEFGSRYRLTPQWSLFATGTFTYAEFPISGEIAIPPFNGVLGVRFEPVPGAYIEPFLRYATFQNRLSDNNLSDRRINPNGTPGFGILNLRAGVPLTAQTTLRLNVNNVFNTSYREFATTLDGPGFGVNLGIDAQF